MTQTLIKQERDFTNTDLFEVRQGTSYTEAERQYSTMLRDCLEQLLEAKCRQVVVLRKAYGANGSARLSVLPAPAGVNRKQLRPEVIEQMLCATLGFVRDGSPGGPVFQSERGGNLVETQMFSTRYPHIVIERVDTFTKGGAPVATEWLLRRTQNQKAETHINRWLDAAGLGVSILKTVTGTT